jgi:predicted NUDIX family NTP pyrophosphohydrolase
MKQSAGLLLYRRWNSGPEVLLVHPGGPYWSKKDEHAWSMPKGEFAAGEDAVAAAFREFEEETGFVPDGTPVPLGVLRASGKVIHAWAIKGDWNPSELRSNECLIEWPPRSGKTATFPEVDRAAWFDLATARTKIHKGQIALLDALEALLTKKAMR